MARFRFSRTTAGYSGPASFTYTVRDQSGGSATATVDVTVDPIEIAGNPGGGKQPDRSLREYGDGVADTNSAALGPR